MPYRKPRPAPDWIDSSIPYAVGGLFGFALGMAVMSLIWQ